MDLLSCMLNALLVSITTIILFDLFLISFARTKASSPKTMKLPPGPRPLPILGNLLKLLPSISQPHKFLAELARVYGPIMTLELGSITAIVISSSTLAKQGLLKNHHVFSSPVVLDAVRAHQHNEFSVGSLPSSSSKWRALRKVYTNSMFGKRMLEALQNQRYQKLEELLCYMRECSHVSVAIDVGQVVYDTSYDIMSNTIFSMDAASDARVREIKDIMGCLIKDIGRPNIVDAYPILKTIDPQRIRHRLTTSCMKLFKLFDEMIDERLKSREERENSSCFNGDLLDVVIDIMEGEQRDVINREDVKHLLLVGFASGSPFHIDATS